MTAGSPRRARSSLRRTRTGPQRAGPQRAGHQWAGPPNGDLIFHGGTLWPPRTQKLLLDGDSLVEAESWCIRGSVRHGRDPGRTGDRIGAIPRSIDLAAVIRDEETLTTVEFILEPAESGPEDPLSLEPAGRKTMVQQVTLAVFLVLPLLALIAAIPVAWGWGLSIQDVVIFAAMYIWTGLGVTVGFHRYLTHRAFRASRPVHLLLTVAGSMSLEASPIQWVADHRRHHRFSDRDGDPHSPWRYGTGTWAVTKGFFYSHVGWLFDWEQTSEEQYAPELVKDPVTSLGLPLLRAHGSLSPFSFRRSSGDSGRGPGRGPWPRSSGRSLVRICLLHHVTFSHQLGMPHHRTKAVQDEGPEHQRVVAGDSVVGRVVAQLPPRRADVGPPRCAALRDRHSAPSSSG